MGAVALVAEEVLGRAVARLRAGGDTVAADLLAACTLDIVVDAVGDVGLSLTGPHVREPGPLDLAVPLAATLAQALAIGSHKRYGYVDRSKSTSEGVGAFNTLPTDELTALHFFNDGADPDSSNKHSVHRFVLPFDQPAKEIVFELHVMGGEGCSEVRKSVVAPQQLGQFLDLKLQCLE